MKGLKRYLIVSAVFLVAYVLAQYYKPKPTDWRPTYLKEDKIPFGLYILYNRIGDIFPGAEIKVSADPVYNTLKNRKGSNSSYLLVNNGLELDKLGCKELLGFAEQGNSVFLATFNFGKLLGDTLKLETGSSFNFTKQRKTRINFVNPYLRSATGYDFEKGIGDQYFNRFDTAKVTILGKNEEGKPNFIRYRYGKGALYLLPNPQLLTNYSLLHPLGAEYAAKALSYLPVSGEVIWDEYYTRGSTEDLSVLRVIFGHEQLRWAYYLAITGLVLFVLLEMKRRQRIIPVLESLKNSSLEFVRLVGQVYYQQRDNGDIARKKVKYFLEHIRAAYYLKTGVIDDDFKGQLAMKSGVGLTTIKTLFKMIGDIEAGKPVSDALLISLNQEMEQFYKQAQ